MATISKRFFTEFNLPFNAKKRAEFSTGPDDALAVHLLRVVQNGKKFCVLYTDSTNGTSNKIYQDIGYKIIGGSKFIVFEDSNV